MTAITTYPTTLRESFSFYVPAKDPQLIRDVAELADAVVVRGPQGPATVAAMRAAGWPGTVLFDYAGYEGASRAVNPTPWLQAQADAGADRLLTPGRWVPWDTDGQVVRKAVMAEQAAGASADEATVLLAIDSRWLSKGIYELLAALAPVKQPVALVLAHRGDPLSAPDAVTGLLALNRKVSRLSILRSDHGALGAIAFGAVHGAVGLRTTYRHFVPPAVKAGGIPNDQSPRLFVADLMDWFSAFNIAGWATVASNLRCRLACCGGQPLASFLDHRRADQVGIHNRTALADLATYVLNAPRTDRRRLFALRCSDAVERYGYMGKLSTFTEPKAQLVQWAQFA